MGIDKDMFDKHPVLDDLLPFSREKTVRQIITHYYLQWFEDEVAEDIADRYIKALLRSAESNC